MNYQLISPLLGLLRLIIGACLLCTLGLWLELLWFAATHDSDAFWRFSEARIAFAIVGTSVACGILFWFQKRRNIPPPRHTGHQDTALFALAAFAGAISGLGLWELLEMLVG